MNLELINRYLKTVSALTVPPATIDVMIQPHLRPEIKNRILQLQTEIQYNASIADIVGPKVWLRLGNCISHMFRFKIECEILNHPHNRTWIGEDKYRKLKEPISCQQIATLLDTVGIPKDHPAVTSLQGCVNSEGQPDFHNRFTERSDYEDFHRRLLE